MRVIEPGTGQKGWAKEFTCSGVGNGMGGCSAKLLVEQGDLFHTYHHDYGGGTDRYTTFKCGACGVLTDISHPSGIGTLPDRTAWEALQVEHEPKPVYPSRFA